MQKENWIFKTLYFSILMLFCFSSSMAQPALPQRSNIVRAIQPIHFGSFCVTGGGGGTVTVGFDGSRSATGNIILLDAPPIAQPAIFEIKFCHSTNVCFNFLTPSILLIGSQGTIPLVVGPTDKGPDGACFKISNNCDIITPMRIGGTLTVPGSSSPGIYTGQFTINYIPQ
jgi:hypothetical protein